MDSSVSGYRERLRVVMNDIHSDIQNAALAVVNQRINSANTSRLAVKGAKSAVIDANSLAVPAGRSSLRILEPDPHDDESLSAVPLIETGATKRAIPREDLLRAENSYTPSLETAVVALREPLQFLMDSAAVAPDNSKSPIKSPISSRLRSSRYFSDFTTADLPHLHLLFIKHHLPTHLNLLLDTVAPSVLPKIAPEDRIRWFEPYFTGTSVARSASTSTKPGGPSLISAMDPAESLTTNASTTYVTDPFLSLLALSSHLSSASRDSVFLLNLLTSLISGLLESNPLSTLFGVLKRTEDFSAPAAPNALSFPSIERPFSCPTPSAWRHHTAALLSLPDRISNAHKGYPPPEFRKSTFFARLGKEWVEGLVREGEQCVVEYGNGIEDDIFVSCWSEVLAKACRLSQIDSFLSHNLEELFIHSQSSSSNSTSLTNDTPSARFASLVRRIVSAMPTSEQERFIEELLKRIDKTVPDRTGTPSMYRSLSLFLLRILPLNDPTSHVYHHLLVTLPLRRPQHTTPRTSRLIVCTVGELNVQEGATGKLFVRFFHSALVSWSDPSLLRHAHHAQHRHLTCLLLLCLAYLRTRPNLLVNNTTPPLSPSVSTVFVEAVSRYLGVSDQSIRVRGMVVAEEGADLVMGRPGKKVSQVEGDSDDEDDVDGEAAEEEPVGGTVKTERRKVLNFDIADVAEVREMREWSETVFSEESTAETDREVANALRPIDQDTPAGSSQAQRIAQKSTRNGLLRPKASRPEQTPSQPSTDADSHRVPDSDDEDDGAFFEPYDTQEDVEDGMTGEAGVDGKVVKAPIYIRDLLVALRSQDVNVLSLAMRHAETIIRRTPTSTTASPRQVIAPKDVDPLGRVTRTDMDEVGCEVVRVLLGMRDEYGVEGWDDMRRTALVAGLVRGGRQVVEYVTEQFFAKEWSVGQRLDILDILTITARELSMDLETTSTSIEVPRLNPIPSSGRTDRPTPQAAAATVIGERLKSKTRRFSSKSEVDKRKLAKGTSRNTYGDVAESMFYGIVGRLGKAG
ncbi:TEL2, telomere maintenance protein 2, partial [Gonapodya sp. JEL0774]